MEFSVKHLTDFEPAEEGHFFTSAEESRLLLSAIQKTPHNDLKVHACSLCVAMTAKVCGHFY